MRGDVSGSDGIGWWAVAAVLAAVVGDNAKVPRTLRVICVFGAMVKGLNPTSGGGSGGGGATQGGTVPETSVGLAAVPAVFSGGGAGSLFVFVSRLGLVELRSPSRVGFVEVDVFKRSVSLRALL